MTKLESFKTSIYNFNESLKSYFEAPKTKVWSFNDYIHVASWLTIIAPLFAALTLGITTGLSSLFGRVKPLPSDDRSKMTSITKSIYVPSDSSIESTVKESSIATHKEAVELRASTEPKTESIKDTVVSSLRPIPEKIDVNLDDILSGEKAENARELLVNCMRKLWKKVSIPDGVHLSPEYTRFITQLEKHGRREANNLDVIHALIELGRDFPNQQTLPDDVLAKVSAFVSVLSHSELALPKKMVKIGDWYMDSSAHLVDSSKDAIYQTVMHTYENNDEDADDDLLLDIAIKLRPILAEQINQYFRKT